MLRPWRAIPILAVPAAVVGVAGCASAPPRAEPAPIEARVLEAVQARDSVAVMVVLVRPTSYDRGPGAQLRRDVRDMQNRVLDVLEDDEYRVRHRFESVPAMTLMVYGEAAVRKLALARDVQRIGLDESAGGGGSP